MANSKLKCKGCGDYYRVMPEHPSFRRWCSDDCALTIISNNRTKRQEQQRKQQEWQKKQDKKSEDKFQELKAKVKANDVPKQHKLTQPVFNKMRVLQEKLWFKERGLDPECISCGKTNMDWCNGHLKTVGSSGVHRYNPINSRLQCNRYCNMALSGNINGNKTTRGYLQGLIDRFGSVEAENILEALSESPVKKWTCEELIKMRKEFNIKIRRLEDLQNTEG